MLNKSTTMFHAALCGEIQDIRTNSTASVSDQPLVDNEGCITIPTQEFIGSAYRSNSFTEKRTNTNFVSNSLHSRIESFAGNKDLLLQFIKDTIGADNTSYYGILASTPDWRINPLHPVTAFMVLHDQIVFPESFTITVYSWAKKPRPDSSKVEHLMAGISKVLAVLPTTGQVSVSNTPRDSFENDTKNMTGEGFLSKTLRFSESGSNPPSVLVPIQFLARSIVYPFYGLVTLRTSGSGADYRSANLWDFFSGNISSQSSVDLDSTCTGDLSNSIFSSLKVLNTLNDHSTYSSNNVPTNPEEFVWACQVLSNALLQQTKQGKPDASQVAAGTTPQRG